ncbi:TonB-dependent receptor [Acidovorax sp.]|uniref:TonB-dependent receptor n=1 Tax=Acidovorax sp. TaxID=1872122 RepID=UPI0025839660|nr:TonB-dependent receptor [Acidovorax sp.]
MRNFHLSSPSRKRPVFAPTPAAIAAAMLCVLALPSAQAQTASTTTANDDKTLSTVTVNASADASAQGLSPAYAGGQVAHGGRAGVLGTRDAMETPFSITSYTNELIQDRHARSVGDVLQNDPTVRVARGFGNFQEAYFIRGFILDSDDTAYNGLYSLLPRQYIATELFERVEVLRGASAFLSGASPGGGGIGGSINLLPKRAPNEPLNRVTFGVGSGGQTQVAADIARRFGPDGSTGIRVNAASHQGGTAVNDEDARLGLLAVGLDWRSRDVRLSGDIGWQDHKLQRTRTNVTLGPSVASVPAAPDNQTNFAQPWSYSNERDTFGTLRGEWDINTSVTAWAAAGARRSEEANALANLTVNNAATGAATTYRFDNTRKDSVNTGELGLRGKLQAGGVGHEWVVVASAFSAEKKNAYAMDYANTQATNLYGPVATSLPAFSANAFRGGDLANPLRTGITRLTSFAVGDTLALMDQRLLLTAGLRHQKIDIGNYAYGTAALTDRYEQSRTSPLLAGVFKLDTSVSLYANYVEGLSQGQTAPSTAANRGDMLAPYVSRQKEVGVKYDGGRVGGSLAFFSTDKPRAYLDSNNVFGTNGKDRHQGLELAVQGEATKGLRLLGGLTWLDAKQQTTGSATTDGKRVIGVPKLQANLGAEWDVPGLPGLALDGRVVHTGASYANATNTLRVSGWNRLDVGARYLTEVQGRLVTLRARIDNLTNRNYWASAGGYPGQGYLVVGAPRTLSISASVDF